MTFLPDYKIISSAGKNDNFLFASPDVKRPIPAIKIKYLTEKIAAIVILKIILHIAGTK